MTVQMESDLAQRIATMADRYGIYPQHVRSDPEVLTQLGLQTEDITDALLTTADRLFHKASEALLERVDKYNARCGETVEYVDLPAVKPAKVKKEKPPAMEKTPRAKIFDFPITAVLRWMGKHKWTYADALAAVTKLVGESSISSCTVKIQLKAGQQGERGEPAPITPAQAKQLRAARNR